MIDLYRGQRVRKVDFGPAKLGNKELLSWASHEYWTVVKDHHAGEPYIQVLPDAHKPGLDRDCECSGDSGGMRVNSFVPVQWKRPDPEGWVDE